MQYQWALERIGPDVTLLTFELKGQWSHPRLLLTSDHHLDNALCDQVLLRRHLEEAKRINAPVFCFGDTFCAMQGKWDKRSDREQLRKEFQTSNDYLDALVKYAEEFYRPYADQMAVISHGNHETSVIDRHGTDLVQQLATRLGCQAMPYSGYVLIRVRYSGKHYTLRLYYDHGSGGAAPVSRGLIPFNRIRDMAEADLYYLGHVHRRNSDENVKTVVSSRGHVDLKREWFLRGSTYKREDQSNFQRERMGGPRPLGGWWVDLNLQSQPRSSSRSTILECRPIPAQ